MATQEGFKFSQLETQKDRYYVLDPTSDEEYEPDKRGEFSFSRGNSAQNTAHTTMRTDCSITTQGEDKDKAARVALNVHPDVNVDDMGTEGLLLKWASRLELESLHLAGVCKELEKNIEQKIHSAQPLKDLKKLSEELKASFAEAMKSSVEEAVRGQVLAISKKYEKQQQELLRKLKSLTPSPENSPIKLEGVENLNKSVENLKKCFGRFEKNIHDELKKNSQQLDTVIKNLDNLPAKRQPLKDITKDANIDKQIGLPSKARSTTRFEDQRLTRSSSNLTRCDIYDVIDSGRTSKRRKLTLPLASRAKTEARACPDFQFDKTHLQAASRFLVMEDDEEVSKEIQL